MGRGSPNRHQQNCSQTARQWLDRAPLFLDTETTGIDERAEICEIAVVAADGTSLVDTLVRPTGPIP
ncbi:MAG: 3'-5' exonuclease, partial [Candidatus Bipolaricaulia bacterium]